VGTIARRRLAIILALIVLAVSVWGVVGRLPRTAPSEFGGVPSPEYTRSGVERARQQIDKEQRYEVGLRQTNAP
jgi:hypothetical protein